jgi:hypothetical protein
LRAQAMMSVIENLKGVRGNRGGPAEHHSAESYAHDDYGVAGVGDVFDRLDECCSESRGG